MTYEEACAIAQDHLDEQPFPHPDYRWRLTQGRELPDGWYFDYACEPVRSMPESEKEQFAGAPGFIVPQDGSGIHVVSWDEFSDRKLDQSRPTI